MSDRPIVRSSEELAWVRQQFARTIKQADEMGEGGSPARASAKAMLELIKWLNGEQSYFDRLVTQWKHCEDERNKPIQGKRCRNGQ